MGITIRNQKMFSPTCLQVPWALKARAKAAGVNMSKTLIEGLERELQNMGTNMAKESLTEKLKECSGIEQAPTSQPAAPSLDPKRRSRQ